jgi:hypothetical protein
MENLKNKKAPMLIFISITLSFFLVTLFIFLLIVSPGKPKLITDQNQQPIEGSISEKIFLKIGAFNKVCL